MTGPGNDGGERDEVLAKVAAIVERYTSGPPTYRRACELRPGDKVAAEHALQLVDTVAVSSYAVFARIAGWPYILNPDEQILVVPVEVER